jgi:hypothetical protein
MLPMRTCGTPPRLLLGLASLIALLASVGCTHDKPHEYGRRRPPVEDLDPRDRGLQSKDVVSASDQMAQDLLGDRDLNESHDRWTVVFDHVENHSTNRRFDMDIFLERLKQNLSRYGHGRVSLIENKAKLRNLQSKELEGEREGDEFGQGSGARGAPGPRGVQPDYAMYAKIMDLPNRATDYYLIEFVLTSLRTREIVWDRSYEVKVER